MKAQTPPVRVESTTPSQPASGASSLDRGTFDGTACRDYGDERDCFPSVVCALADVGTFIFWTVWVVLISAAVWIALGRLIT